jgi:hypothetical protein
MKRLSLIICLVILLLLIPAGIPIAAASPIISGISPSTGPDNGVVTITVTGTGFNLASLIRLNKCKLATGGKSQAPFTGTIISKSATSITATFDLTGKVVGDYSVSLNAPFDNHDDWGDSPYGFFTIYSATGPTPAATATTTTETVATTATTVSTGDNSVFFQTDPTGAEIWLDGEDVGTSTFTYYTNHEGTFDVVVKKIGYEDYPAKVTILEGKRVSFMAPLTPLSSSDISADTTKASATPGKTTPSGKNTTAFQKSTMKVPTPWGTDPPATEESPVDPALALGAAGIAIGLVLLRRR